MRRSGFSLIELLLAMTLLAILLVVAIPMTQSLLTRNRVTQHAAELVTALNYARSEAVKRGSLVTFCKSKAGKSCEGDWRDGQIVIVDKQVLRQYAALTNGDNLIWRSSLGKNEMLQFAPAGFTHGQSGSFYYCPAEKQYAKRIVVEQSGRTRIMDDSSGCP